jgi:CRP-like cAMP-binding protein
MVEETRTPFSVTEFLTQTGPGKARVKLNPNEPLFAQGQLADAIYFLQEGRAKLTVVSANGKEATITLLTTGDLVGEEALAHSGSRRLATATALTPCTTMRIARDEVIRVLHQQPEFSDFFLKFLLARSMRTQSDLVDQLFNSSEKRLARILLLMANYGMPGEPEMLLPHVTQETLAEMIGTTRSRVSFFMNRFRKLGLIEYNGRIRVHRSLLNVILHDELPDHNSQKPSLPQNAAARSPSKSRPSKQRASLTR